MDAREMPDGAVWGDLRTIVAQRRGVHGTVVDGAVRDVSACISLGFPIFTRWRTMLTGGGRAWIEAKQVPVSIGGVYVRPGDLILGDADGVLVVPQEKEAEVTERAQALEQADRKITAALLEGMPLTQARQAYGAKKYLPSKS
jgi:regulator of RNase E activity RraA